MLLLTSACKSVSAHAVRTSDSFIGASTKSFEKANKPLFIVHVRPSKSYTVVQNEAPQLQK